MGTQATSDDANCKICDGLSSGTHFGVVSCRACAAFFRRTLTSKSKFQCFQSCPNSKDCKKCRLDKCVAAGMIPTVNLQSKVSDKNGVSPIPTTLTTHPEITLLHRLVANYKDFTRERFIYERELLESNKVLDVSPLQLTPPDEAECFTVRVAQFDMTNTIWRGVAERAVDMLANSFDEIHSVPDQEKFASLQNFIFLLYSSESYYRSVKTFKERPMQSLFVSSTTTIEFSHYDKFFEGTLIAKPYGQVLDKFVELNTQSRDLLVPILDRLKLTEIEFVASVVIALWSTSSETNFQQLSKIGDSYRKRVFKELHVLYRDVFKLDDYASRLGELMTLTNAFQMCASKTLSELQFFNFFDVFDKNSFAASIARKNKIKNEPMF